MAEITLRVVRLEHAEAVANRDAGRDDEETARNRLAAGMARCVDRLPGDDHRHDRGFACAGRELEREAQQFRVRLRVRVPDVIPELAKARAHFRRDFREPDRRFDCLDLAEEGLDALKPVAAPMFQEPSRFRRDEPLLRVTQVSPRLDVGPELVDDRGGVVLLLVRREVVAGVEGHRHLVRRFATLLGLRNRRDQLGPTPGLNEAVGRLPFSVKLPVPTRVAIRRIQDRPFEKLIRQSDFP